MAYDTHDECLSHGEIGSEGNWQLGMREIWNPGEKLGMRETGDPGEKLGIGNEKNWEWEKLGIGNQRNWESGREIGNEENWELGMRETGNWEWEKLGIQERNWGSRLKMPPRHPSTPGQDQGLTLSQVISPDLSWVYFHFSPRRSQSQTLQWEQNSSLAGQAARAGRAVPAARGELCNWAWVTPFPAGAQPALLIYSLFHFNLFISPAALHRSAARGLWERKNK